MTMPIVAGLAPQLVIFFQQLRAPLPRLGGLAYFPLKVARRWLFLPLLN
jgi:hypothetical protein